MLAGPRRPQTDQAEHGRPHGDHDGEWQREREAAGAGARKGTVRRGEG